MKNLYVHEMISVICVIFIFIFYSENKIDRSIYTSEESELNLLTTLVPFPLPGLRGFECNIDAAAELFPWIIGEISCLIWSSISSQEWISNVLKQIIQNKK